MRIKVGVKSIIHPPRVKEFVLCVNHAIIEEISCTESKHGQTSIGCAAVTAAQRQSERRCRLKQIAAEEKCNAWSEAVCLDVLSSLQWRGGPWIKLPGYSLASGVASPLKYRDCHITLISTTTINIAGAGRNADIILLTVAYLK